MIICDTGPLVAAALSNDSHHLACVRLFNDLHAAGREMLVSATVVAEVGYLLNREAGPHVESLFLRSMADGDFTALDLSAADYARMADLVIKYGSLPLGATDASVVAVAERLKLTEVATLDRRHFQHCATRPRHGADTATPATRWRVRLCRLASGSRLQALCWRLDPRFRR